MKEKKIPVKGGFRKAVFVVSAIWVSLMTDEAVEHTKSLDVKLDKPLNLSESQCFHLKTGIFKRTYFRVLVGRFNEITQKKYTALSTLTGTWWAPGGSFTLSSSVNCFSYPLPIFLLRCFIFFLLIYKNCLLQNWVRTTPFVFHLLQIFFPQFVVCLSVHLR